MNISQRQLRIAGTATTIATLERAGAATPIVFLHGFGSTKEDYADIVLHPALAAHPVLAYDAPGCGRSTIDHPDRVDIPFLVDIAQALMDDLDMKRVHLVGHSMGGLTALRLATARPDLVASIVSIEGNLAPEDCFLSRQIIDHDHADATHFLTEFRDRVARSRYAASALYTAGLPAKVRAEVVRPIFESMVELSDHAPLLDDFLAIAAPRMLMHGDQNATLSYLPALRDAGVDVTEISMSGHFPMYSNPLEMWARLSAFITAAE
ncbi:alpha/beta fold hydrolase [Arenivirga flava]|uniref:alpha/beta fold hydrolase n=1 Tax=Arenivirga flava TaxID=1930060 RepID=UPI0024E0F6C8|nr:alpha/beta hydrolase [Arenivirga flava]